MTKELVPMPDFIDNYLHKVGPKEFRLHGQLFPLVYPANRPDYEKIKNSEAPITATLSDVYYDSLRQMTAQDSKVGRLRVLAHEGFANMTLSDIDISIRTFDSTKARGERTRFTQFSRRVLELVQACPGNPLVGSYLDGILTDDPKASFWSMRRLPTAQPAFIGIMNYHKSELQPVEVYTPPFPKPIQDYEAFWYNAYQSSSELR